MAHMHVDRSYIIYICNSLFRADNANWRSNDDIFCWQITVQESNAIEALLTFWCLKDLTAWQRLAKHSKIIYGAANDNKEEHFREWHSVLRKFSFVNGLYPERSDETSLFQKRSIRR